VTILYLDLVDFVEIACEVTGLDTATVLSMANLDLADSASTHLLQVLATLISTQIS
jgi:hypothetical protein